jgi:hypothetical protein
VITRKSNDMISIFVLAAFLIFSSIGIAQVYAVPLNVVEEKVNKNSITGVLQNQHDFPVCCIDLRAEFYGKDGHLVGIRDFFELQKYELEPGERTTFKIFEDVDYMREFPKADYVIKAEAIDETKTETTSVDEIIADLNRIPREIVTTVTVVENGTNATGTNVTQMNVTQMNVTEMNVAQMNVTE